MSKTKIEILEKIAKQEARKIISLPKTLYSFLAGPVLYSKTVGKSASFQGSQKVATNFKGGYAPSQEVLEDLSYQPPDALSIVPQNALSQEESEMIGVMEFTDGSHTGEDPNVDGFKQDFDENAFASMLRNPHWRGPIQKPYSESSD